MGPGIRGYAFGCTMYDQEAWEKIGKLHVWFRYIESLFFLLCIQAKNVYCHCFFIYTGVQNDNYYQDIQHGEIPPKYEMLPLLIGLIGRNQHVQEAA